MKKIITFMLLSICVSVSAQTVSSVSYNPSRSGTYSNLKAADQIMFLGGLTTNTLQVISAATFAWKDGSPGTYSATAITGLGTLDFPQAVVSGYDLTTTNPGTYSAQSNTPAINFSGSNPINFTLAGGIAEFGEDSYVGSIDSHLTVSRTSAGTLRLSATNVNMPSSTLTIFGHNENTTGILVPVSGNTSYQTNFFRLVGGDIPDPNGVSGNLQWCQTLACTKDDCSTTNPVLVLCYK